VLAEKYGPDQIVGGVHEYLRFQQAEDDQTPDVHGAGVRWPAVCAVRTAGRAPRDVRHRRSHRARALDRRGRRLDLPQRQRRCTVRGGRLGVKTRGTRVRRRAMRWTGQPNAAVCGRVRQSIVGETVGHGRQRRSEDGRGRDKRRLRRPTRGRPL